MGCGRRECWELEKEKEEVVECRSSVQRVRSRRVVCGELRFVGREVVFVVGVGVRVRELGRFVGGGEGFVRGGGCK